jgi:hypothetical protein
MYSKTWKEGDSIYQIDGEFWMPIWSFIVWYKPYLFKEKIFCVIEKINAKGNCSVNGGYLV